MKKELIRISVALLVLLGLVLLVRSHRKGQEEKTAQEEQENKIVKTDLEKINRIILINKNGRVILERRGKSNEEFDDQWAKLSNEQLAVSDWKVVDPYQDLADLGAAKTLIENLETLEKEKVINETGERLGEYGIPTPSVLIKLFANKDQKDPTLTVNVGQDNPSHSGVYIQTSDHPRVVLSDKTLAYLRNRKPQEWRNRNILDWQDIKSVKKIEVEYPSEKKSAGWVAERTSEENWAITSPEKVPGDRTQITRFLNDLKSMSSTEVVAEMASEAGEKYGLNNPYSRIKLHVDNGKTKWTIQVEVGSTFNKEEGIYVRRTDFPYVHEVAYSLKDQITKGLNDLVSKKPMQMSQEKISNLRIVDSKKEKIELSKKNGNWVYVEPDGAWADDSYASALVTAIVSLTAEEFLGTTEPKKIGDPLYSIQVAGKKPEEVFFYLDLFQSGEKVIGKVVEPKSSLELFYRFPKSTPISLERDIDRVRDKRLIQLETEKLSSVQLKHGQKTVDLIRTQSGEWRLGKVQGIEAELQASLREPDTVKKLVYAIEDLQIEKFFDQTPEALAAGAAPKHFELRFVPEKGDPVDYVFYLNQEKNEIYARSDERKYVGTIRMEDAESLLEFLESTEKEDKKG